MALKSLFLGVLLLHLCISSSSSDPDERAHDYLRFAEVERHCRPLLSSATVLAYDTDRGSGLKSELSFEKGDWFQDASGHAPLMPFDGSDVPSGGARRQIMDPLSLATLMLTHVDLGQRGGAMTALNASGVLELSISRKSRDSDSQIVVSPFMTTAPATSSSPEFKISPGAAELSIKFEGVYTETAKGGGGDGDRVLCMVGSALLPARSTGGADPWDWAKNSGSSDFLPPVRADDSILLVLRFPMMAKLTTRAVLGEMRSTSAASAAAYFDPVQLVSQLSSYPHHQPEELVDNACIRQLPSIESSEIVAGSRGGGKLFNGSNLCRVLERYSYGHGVVTSPSTWQWQCSSTTSTAHDGASCRSSLGPFETDRAVSGEDELAEVGIVMKDLQCYSDPATGTERVSFVLRALPPWEDHQTAVQRSGLSGMTLSAEGFWMPSAGKACLVACRGTGDKECHFRISLYIPMMFSITRRSILLGQITSVGGGVARSSSLSFQLGLSSRQYWGFHDGERLALEYNYTKVNLAGELLRRSESRFGLRRIIASSLPVRYPRAYELTLRFTTELGMFRPGWMDGSAVAHLDIIFLEEVARASTITSDTEGSSISEKKKKRQLLINVSAELTFLVPFRAASSGMSLEGVYDPENGRMHLIGCRDVRQLRWPSNNLSANGDLDLEEAGMDCSIEVRVDYPPTNTQWFIWSTAKVRLASTRDPLHFHTMRLQAVPTQYSNPHPDAVSKGIINGVLGIVLLSASIAAALSQLRHLSTHADVAPYVSLAMLFVQALGFVMPLFTGIDALVAKATIRRSDRTSSSSRSASSYALAMNYPICRSMDRAVKVLSLAAFAVTLCLVQKVHRSRARMLARSPPCEAKVLVYQCAAHLALFVLVLALNGQHAMMTVEQHVALLQDLFLLPQVIRNTLWRVNCRPLVESYYLGVTAARLLLSHMYELVRPPSPFVYSNEYLSARRGRDVFSDSNAWDVAVPAGAVLLGVVVYVQQRWNYAIVCRMGVRTEQRKLQHIF